MPQLDLTWFLFNFLLSWTLILTVLSAFLNQSWENNNQLTEPTKSYSLNSNNWRW
uniref:ATP synthase F0 subunit 8 n=1 Tax=Holothuria sp. Ciliksiz TaxID=3238277 RepID=A0AB39A6C4_9ECHN